VLYFSLVAPAICYLFFLHDVLYVFLAKNDDDDDDILNQAGLLTTGGCHGASVCLNAGIAADAGV